MLRAGALIYSLAVAVIVGLLSSGLVFYAFHAQLSLDYNQQTLRLTDNAASGIQWLLSEGAQAGATRRVQDLYGNATDTVVLQAAPWGVFQKLTATALWRNNRFSQVALAGQGVEPEGGVALYLADQNQPLSLCGRTVVKGRCQLPKAGPKRAYIEGQNYVGDRLIYGSVTTSQRQVPALAIQHFAELDYLNGSPSLADSLLQWDNLTVDSLSHSFRRKTVLLYSDQSIALTRQRLSGNLRIVSRNSVFIGRQARLDNVIVTAPRVTVEAGFEGNLQIFASDSIAVEEGVLLNYPSALVVEAKDGSGVGGITIAEQARVAGCVVLQVPGVLPRSNWLLAIGPEAEIVGQVYAGHLLELKGSVLGTVWARQLYLKTPASVYGNHLLNATVDRSKLSPSFVGISLKSATEKFKIAQWLE